MSSSVALWQALAFSVKCSLMWGYSSTDFEVHRNWMAITYNEPLSKWYFNEKSIWTLDYPPFFAYFEWCLAQIAARIDPDIVRLSAERVVTDNVILFQRGSVILSEYILEWAALSCMTYFVRFKNSTVRDAVHLLLIFNGGLIMVDHMHFQYNGMLLGILVSTFVACSRQNYVMMAWIFSCLVLFKHLFMTLAPVYALFLWRFYCVKDSRLSDISVYCRFVTLALVAIVALLVCFCPVLLYDLRAEDVGVSLDIIKDRFLQILSRMFPFGRGLVHSYWAPNVWAMYYFFDRFVYAALKSLSKFPQIGALLPATAANGASSSTVSGLVGGASPAIFKDVSAPVCMVLVLVFMIPALRKVMTARVADKEDSTNPTTLLIKCVVHASLTSFLFGYHVHEKAILVPLIAQTLLLGGEHPENSRRDGTRVAYELHFELAVAGVAGLLPLFPNEAERYKKLMIFLGYIFLTSRKEVSGGNHLGKWSKVMALTVIGAAVLTEIGYPLAASQSSFPVVAAICSKFEFMPLMITSVTSAMFLIHAWFKSLQQLRVE